MKQMTLDEIFEHGKAFAERQFNEDGSLCPMWIAQTGDGMLIPIVAPVDDKEKLIQAIKMIFHEKGVVRYVNLVEAWSLEGGPELKEIAEEGGSISKHPRRVEIVLVVAEDRMEQRIGMFRVNRSGTKPMLDSFKEMPREGSFEGRFSGLIQGQVGHA